MLDYLLKSGVCLTAFFLFYKLFLEKETIHIFKRFYLLGGLLLAFAIPLITFTTTIQVEPMVMAPINYSEVTFEPQPIFDTEVTPINYWPIILWTIYGFGVVLFGLKFIFNLYQIGSKVRNNPKQKAKGFTHVLLQHLITPHTFFSYIFLNKQQYEELKIPQEVFWHEETHAKQKHSFDVVFMEILQVLFWFNPLFYFIKKDIKLNHEFLADRAVLNKGVSLTAYQEILLTFSTNATEPQLANALNYSSIKKRFNIMKTKTSKKAVWIKSLVLLPLVAVLIYSFSREKIIEVLASNETVQIDLEDVNNLKINYSKTQDLKVPNIEININRNKEILINSENYTSIKTLKKEIERIIKDYTPDQISKIKTIIEADGSLKMGFIVDVEMELRHAGLKWRKLQYYGDNSKMGITRDHVIEYNKFWDISSPEFYYTQQTYWIKNNNGKKIAKKYYDLSESNKRKWLVYPPNIYSRKQISNDEFEKIKDATNYVVRINGVAIENKKLNNYKRTDFATYSSNQISEFAQIPQKYHYNLITEDGFKVSLKARKVLNKLNTDYQNKATPQEIAEYNKLAKEYNKQPKYRRIVKMKDYNRMEYIFNKMTSKQKHYAQPFPSLPPSPQPSNNISVGLLNKQTTQGSKGTLSIPMSYNVRMTYNIYDRFKYKSNVYAGSKREYPLATPTSSPVPVKSQDNVSPAEIKEYNKTAKHYNAMSKNDIVVKLKDVERLQFIYNKMTLNQKNAAESFPDFPAPPQSDEHWLLKRPVYQAINPDSIHPLMISGYNKTRSSIPMSDSSEIENKTANNYQFKSTMRVGKKIGYSNDTLPPPAPKVIKNETQYRYDIPPPPPPVPSQKIINKGSIELQKAFKEFSEESKTYGASVQNYRTTKKGLSNVEDEYKKVMELHQTYSKLATAEGILPTPPPPPMTPPNPIDHIVEMAKQNALFYYEDKKITSDKAIELTKENKSLHIQVLSEGSSKPIVKLSKKPITVKN